MMLPLPFFLPENLLESFPCQLLISTMWFLLSGDFGRAFVTTCIGKLEDEKQKWVRALADLANISGVNSHKWDNEANIFKKSGCDFLEEIDDTTSEDSIEMIGVDEDVTDIGAWESEEVNKTVGISGSLGKAAGREINARMVSMPVEPPKSVSRRRESDKIRIMES